MATAIRRAAITTAVRTATIAPARILPRGRRTITTAIPRATAIIVAGATQQHQI